MKEYEYMGSINLKEILINIKKYIDIKIALLLSNKLGISTIVEDTNDLVTSAGIKEYADKKFAEIKNADTIKY